MEKLLDMLTEDQLKALEIKYGKSVRKTLLQPTGRSNNTERMFRQVGAPHLWTFRYERGKIIGVTRATIKC